MTLAIFAVLSFSFCAAAETAPAKTPAVSAAVPSTQAAYWGLRHYFENPDPPLESLAAALHYAAQSPDREAVLKPFAAQAAAKAAALRERSQMKTYLGEEARRAWALLAEVYPAQVEAPPALEEKAEATATALVAGSPAPPDDSPILTEAARLSERLISEDDPAFALRDLRILVQGHPEDPAVRSMVLSTAGRRLNSIHRTDHRIAVMTALADLATESTVPEVHQETIAAFMNAGSRSRSSYFALEAVKQASRIAKSKLGNSRTKEVALAYLLRESALAGRNRSWVDQEIGVLLQWSGLNPPVIPSVPESEVQRRASVISQFRAVFDPGQDKNRRDALRVAAGLGAALLGAIWLGVPWWMAAAVGLNVAIAAETQLWRGKRLLKIAGQAAMVFFPALACLGGTVPAYLGLGASWIGLVVSLFSSEADNRVFLGLFFVDAFAALVMVVTLVPK